MVGRPRAIRKANERLQAVMEEAGCSNTGLARRVNTCGAERGLDLHYDKTSVARWLQGQQPRGRVPAVIAEALGRKLGHTVTVDDIGMNPVPGLGPTAGLRFEPALSDALQQVCALWRADAHRTGLSPTERPASSVLVQSSRDWLIADPDPTAVGSGDTAVSPKDIVTMRAATAAFAELDHRFGSGHVRPATVGHLDGTVSGLLRGLYGETTGRQLFGAAARLTELAGYMAVDSNQFGLAQRYYIQALRLAQAAGDRAFGGYVLASGMSHVALVLGNPREAVQLARVAREGARGWNGTSAETVFYATEARGQALLGDAQACKKAAEQAVEISASGDHDRDPDWAVHVDRSYLAEELARCYEDLNDYETAARWAQEALKGCPPRRARRRVLRLLLLASTLLKQGEIDRSHDTAAQAQEALPGLHSAQCNDALDAYHGLLNALGHSGGARELIAPRRN
jgi:tetratricopeptide (TPR) repeat protein